jgi:ribosomal protein S18 acetylase RimI-like enzyme
MTSLAQLDGTQMRTLAGAAASIYGAAMKRSPEVVVQRRDIIAGHTTYPGFVAAGAFTTDDDAPDPTAGELIGFGYGYVGASGQWWHDTVSHALGRDGSRRWLRHGFELAELHVLPDHHGAGLGRRLLTDVLSRAAAKHAVLSTPDTESPARLLYRSVGFEDLLCGFYFPGSSECYAIMGVDL